MSLSNNQESSLRCTKLSEILLFVFLCRKWLPALFILIALPSTLMLAEMVPYGQVADEPTHAGRILAMLNGEFIGHRLTQVSTVFGKFVNSGIDVDQAIVLAATKPMGGSIIETRDALTEKYQQPWINDHHFMGAPPLAIYAPVFYIPGAIGMAVAVMLHLSPYHTGILGRLADSFTYLILGTIALSVARRAQTVFFVVLTLPMSLNLAASLNQDGLIIATSVLAAALLSRSWDEMLANQSILSRRTTWYAATALFAIALVKPPYLVLAGALLLPSQTWLQSIRQKLPRREILLRIILFAAGIFIVCAWFAFVMWHISAPSYFYPPRPVGPLLKGIHPAMLEHTDPGLQMRVLLEKPIRILSLPLNTFWQNPLWREMVGVLGWLDIVLPNYLYNLWYTAGLLACLAAALTVTTKARYDFSGKNASDMVDSVFILLLVFLTFILIYISQFLDWTDVGNAFIEGPQGRYLLPLLPFIGLAIPRLQFPGSAWLKSGLTALIIIPGIIGLAVLPNIILRAYYLH